MKQMSKVNNRIEELKGRQSDHKVPNLVRGISLLELLSEHRAGLRLADIAALMGWPKNSTSRVAATLQQYGFLRRNDEKRFSLTRKLLMLGCGSSDNGGLVQAAWDAMRELRDLTGETVVLGALGERCGVVLEEALSPHAFKFQIEVGTTFPLHSAAPGKAMWAFLPEHQREELLQQVKLERFTDTTITTKKALRNELESIRQCGYSLDRSEMLAGCHCVGAPIYDHLNYPFAAVWVTGPANRLLEKDFVKLGPKVADAARRISQNYIRQL